MLSSEQHPNQCRSNFPLYDFDSVWVPNPHGQVQDSAATHGLINSIKSGSLDSLLTNTRANVDFRCNSNFGCDCCCFNNTF